MLLEAWAISTLLEEGDDKPSNYAIAQEKKRIMNFKFHCVCGHEMDEHDEDGCHGIDKEGFINKKEIKCTCDYQKDRRPVTFADLVRQQEREKENEL